MTRSNDLMNRINERYSRLSKGQKLLATYITDNYDKAAFLTAAKLGKVVGVSESTVVRFATQLDYKGYPEFQKALEELVRDKLSSAQPSEVTFDRIDRKEVLDSVLGSDIDNIRDTLENIDHSAFDMAVETILSARKIYIIGLRSCAPLAQYLGFYMKMVFEDVIVLQTTSSNELFEQTLHISENDVMIGISFPRYSMRTLKMLEFANNRSAKVVTLTDSVHSPMNLYSSCNLLAKSTMASATDSLTAPLSVINALIVALFMRKRDVLVKTLEDMEEIWDEYQVYDNDEMGYIGDSVKMKFSKPEEADSE
ncbi:MAG: MurR/RpiR family transcriptional regulator [Lachnospiraceae bacterium]|nr:MurR/RpiR family transcriptional regulator [Lachnospiraceae bacterium]